VNHDVRTSIDQRLRKRGGIERIGDERCGAERAK
jgi:hypothetical protein